MTPRSLLPLFLVITLAPGVLSGCTIVDWLIDPSDGGSEPVADMPDDGEMTIADMASDMSQPVADMKPVEVLEDMREGEPDLKMEDEPDMKPAPDMREDEPDMRDLEPDMSEDECPPSNDTFVIPFYPGVAMDARLVGDYLIEVAGTRYDNGGQIDDVYYRVRTPADNEPDPPSVLPNTQNSAGYGAAVALSPDARFLAVGDPLQDLVHIYKRSGSGAAYGSVVSLGIPSRDAGVSTDPLFGFSLAIGQSGEGSGANYTLVIGAPRDDGFFGGSEFYDTGAVYLYENTNPDTGNAWAAVVVGEDLRSQADNRVTLRAPHLTGPDQFPAYAANSALFGWSVAATGSFSQDDLTVVVGAPGADFYPFAADVCRQNRSGAALILAQDPSAQAPGKSLTWFDNAGPKKYDAAINDLGPGQEDGNLPPWVGLDVALLGGLDASGADYAGVIQVAIGAPGADVEGREDIGGVMIYRTMPANGSASVREELLTVPHILASPGDQVGFGFSVDMRGEIACTTDTCEQLSVADFMVLIGAPFMDANGGGEGAFYATIANVGGPINWSHVFTEGRGRAEDGTGRSVVVSRAPTFVSGAYVGFVSHLQGNWSHQISFPTSPPPATP